MSDTIPTVSENAPPSVASATPVDDEARAEPARFACLARLLATDVGIGILIGVMIVAIVLFSSGASKFVYIDF